MSQDSPSSTARHTKVFQSLLVTTQVSVDRLVEKCEELAKADLPLKMITALDERQESDSFKLLYVFGDRVNHIFPTLVVSVTETGKVPSIARVVPAATNFERKIQTFFGLEFLGHPDPRPLILHENWPSNRFPLRKDFLLTTRPDWSEGSYQFAEIKGEGNYEIPVGPVHAGVIEPGHFRFTVSGEEILFLEPRLGYVHKGVEKLMEAATLEEKIQLAEQVSGDSAFSHSLAFCQAIESLSAVRVPKRAQTLRVIYAELERLANHFNDIGFIMMDTGFAFGGASGARLREQIMQWHERLSGNRYLRGINRVGGVTTDISSEHLGKLRGDLHQIQQEFTDLIEIATQTESVLNRLIETGTLSADVVRDLAVVGVAGRASGLEIDTRVDYPYAGYDELTVEQIHKMTGDVFARFSVRVEECLNSFALIQTALGRLEDAPKTLAVDVNEKLPKNAVALGAVEGWRGEILYLVATDGNGHITRVDIRDPSFMNWSAVPHAVRGNMVPDFPLINKSFNLSYSGNDL